MRSVPATLLSGCPSARPAQPGLTLGDGAAPAPPADPQLIQVDFRPLHG